MSLSTFSLASLRTQKRAKSMFLNAAPEIEIDTSIIKQIGNYRLGEEIGSGAFGKVILGLHIITGEKVAIKILDKLILSQTPEDYELVKQELSILKIVKHKYIVQLYEILETPQHIFIIMEYCEGQDIMDYILTRGRLSEDESLKYFQQLINALYYLHSQNITHRDIKIDNLLLDRNLDLKLIDFGLSTKYRDDCLLSQPCGTVVYAAPEVLDCREYHGMLADVWSSGIVLFGMLSGFLPFGDPDDEVNKKLVLQGKIEIPHFFSKSATDLLKHMLDINPLTRYTLEDIMVHPWFNKNKFRLIPGIIIGVNKIPVDEKIVNLCVTYNMDKQKIRDSVINNKFNTESALYYLLVKKLKACGNDSVSDFCSNAFIKYIIDETNKLNYLSQIQKIYQMNLEREREMLKEKIKEKEKDKKRLIVQINDYITNNDSKKDKQIKNTKESEVDLSAAPGLISDYNYNNPKRFSYNVMNMENNFSINNSRNYDDSDILNYNERENSTISDLRQNLVETEFNRNAIDTEEFEDYLLEREKQIEGSHKIFTKGKMDPNALYMNYINKKKNSTKINKNLISNLNASNDNNRFNKSANNKKRERFIKDRIDKGLKKEKIKEKSHKFKELSRNKPPLTSRNDLNNCPNNSKLYSTQFSNIKKKNKRKIMPMQKELYNKLKVKKNKENTSVVFKQNNMLDKKEMITNESAKQYLKQSKICNQKIHIPLLNINKKDNKLSSKKKNDKRKFIKTNLYENSKEINTKIMVNNNRSIDSRNGLNTQRNNDINNNMFKTIYNKKSDTNRVKYNNNNNFKQLLFKNKLNSKSIESRQKYIIDSSSKEKKINKSNLLNLLDNFQLYQKGSNHLNSNCNSIVNKTNMNKSNKNKIIKNYKKDFSYIHTPLLTFDNNRPQDDQSNQDGSNTDRNTTIFNLKNQSCFEKDNNFTNSNNKKIKSKKKIKDNSSKVVIKQNNQNELIRSKIKEYYIRRKKIGNLNIKDINNISYSIGNKINNNNNTNNITITNATVNQNTFNSNNNQLTTRSNLNSNINTINTINNDKCNTSRINVTLRNKSIKERNLNHKKMNTSILTSINKIKDYKKLRTKLIKPKRIFPESMTNNSNININRNNNNDNNSNNTNTTNNNKSNSICNSNSINNKLNPIIRIKCLESNKNKSIMSLSKDKKKKEENNNKNAINKKPHHLESSVIVYRKKSPYKIRDLSDSPKQKYLNEKTRNKRIPWKIKKKD
jgi:5'-AMP-activated protein kinase catalytic alpha subunit